ncbi:MAG: tyrosine--tRNA ligase [archaeon]
MEKAEILKRNSLEIVPEEKIESILKKENPVAYCGYEPNGPVHLGHLVTLLKLKDLSEIGFHVKVLLADLHAFLNMKDLQEIEENMEHWKKFSKKLLNCEVVVGSSFQLEKDYMSDVLRLSQKITIDRGLRSMQGIARDFDNAHISQIIYPLMQVMDIKYLGVDLAVGGMEQRKVHMLALENLKDFGHECVYLHMPLLDSLLGPGQKMSKSIPGSCIFVTDSDEKIEKAIMNAFCPAGENNPVLQIAKYIIFSMEKEFEIKRPEKYGGDLKIEKYEDLERLFFEKKIHPLDLKKAVSESLKEILGRLRV